MSHRQDLWYANNNGPIEYQVITTLEIHAKTEILPSNTIHGVFNGSVGDFDEFIEHYVRFLELVAKNWEPTVNDAWRAYDNAAYNFVVAAIKEGKEYLIEE